MYGIIASFGIVGGIMQQPYTAIMGGILILLLGIGGMFIFILLFLFSTLFSCNLMAFTGHKGKLFFF